MAIESRNPTTEELMKSFQPMSSEEVDEKIARSQSVGMTYRKTPLDQRSTWMKSVALILEQELEKWATLMTLEMGKPIQSARDEVLKCALTCRYYADHAAQFLADQQVKTRASRSYVCYQPLGPVLAIMPWNFPFWQVFRFAAPALMAGNTALLKHASNVPQCAQAIESIFLRAGFSEGVFQTLLIEAKHTERWIEDSRVRAVTLTGSEHAGSLVGAAAGRSLKKVVLELGGSDPFIVMPSADLNRAVSVAVQSRLINNGQSCISAKRFLVEHSVYDEFLKSFCEKMGQIRMGDPMDPLTQLGPLATQAAQQEVDSLVRQSIQKGARVELGGALKAAQGYFYPPTVITQVGVQAPLYHEEVFGPVAQIYSVKDLAHAIQIANSSRFGLGASLWSSDRDEHSAFIDQIESGLCFINDMVVSDPALPFGGVKRSGFGRELGSVGIHEFMNFKSVWIH